MNLDKKALLRRPKPKWNDCGKSREYGVTHNLAGIKEVEESPGRGVISASSDAGVGGAHAIDVEVDVSNHIDTGGTDGGIGEHGRKRRGLLQHAFRTCHEGIARPRMEPINGAARHQAREGESARSEALSDW